MKIQIVSLPRTGSSYLRQMLNYKLHSDMYNYDVDENEPFNDENYHQLGKEKEYYALGKIHKILSNNNVVVKNHYYHLYRLYKDFPKLYEKYNKNNFINYCLLRKNFFESCLSTAIASKTNSWSTPYAYDNNLNLEIPFSEFEEELKIYKNYWLLVAENRLKIEYKKIVYYEDLTFNHSIDYDYINNNDTPLNSSYTSNSVELSKKSPEKMIIVKNYNELKELSYAFVNSIKHKNIINTNGMLKLNETS